MSAEGDLDFRGTLGVDKAARVGLQRSALHSTSSDAPQDKLDTLLRLTERYCVVLQTLSSSPDLDVTLKRT